MTKNLDIVDLWYLEVLVETDKKDLNRRGISTKRQDRLLILIKTIQDNYDA